MNIPYQTILNSINGSSSATEEVYNQILSISQCTINKMVGSNPVLHKQIDDIKQDVSLKVFDKLGQFQPTSTFESWVATITKNHILDILRRSKTRMDSFDDVEISESESKHFENCDLLNEILSNSKFSPIQLEVLQLLYIKEMKYQQIADSLSLPIGTVRTIIHRLKKELMIVSKEYEFAR